MAAYVNESVEACGTFLFLLTLSGEQDFPNETARARYIAEFVQRFEALPNSPKLRAA
jgi:hypothetical protein